MNPFLEIRSPWPARLGAFCAVAVTLALSLGAFFLLLPPVLDVPGRDPVAIVLPLLASEVGILARNADCGAGLAGLLALNCRLLAVWDGVVSSPVASALVARMVGIALAITAAGWIAFNRIRLSTPRSDRLTHVRGRRLRQDVAARGSAAPSSRPNRNPDRTRPLAPAACATLARGRELQHPGARHARSRQGAGKTGMLRAWLEQLIVRGDRVVVHDVKGDMTAGLPIDRFILLAPHDARSAAWDIARDIGDRAAALEFATRSIKAAQADSMWADGARALWAGAIVSLMAEHCQDWTLRDLDKRLTSSPEEFRAALLRSGAASAELIAFDESGGVQRTSMSLLITLWVAALTALKPLVDAWEDVLSARRFSLTGWLSEDARPPATIVIQKSAEYPELPALVGGLLVERLADLVLAPGRKRNPSQKIALVLDELAELGRLERFPALLSVGREVGVMAIAAVQDLGQLIEIYDETVARTLEACFGIKIIGRLTAGDTAERISEVWVGERLVKSFDPVPGGAHAERTPQRPRETHPVFPPERMETELCVRTVRGNAQIRCLVLGLGDPALVDPPFTAWPDRRPAHRPASWRRAGDRRAGS